MSRRIKMTEKISQLATDLGRSALPLTDEQMQRWAELIANGDDRFPIGLAAADQDRLVDEVRRRRRERLIRYIARVIALDVHNAAQNESE